MNLSRAKFDNRSSIREQNIKRLSKFYPQFDSAYAELGLSNIRRTEDIASQLKGIDLIANFRGQDFTLEEKADSIAYKSHNIGLEILSNVDKNIKGWIYHLESDFLAYGIMKHKKLIRLLILDIEKLRKNLEENTFNSCKVRKVFHPYELKFSKVILIPITLLESLGIIITEVSTSK